MRVFLSLLFWSLAALGLSAETNSAPIRLAIVPENSEAGTAADVLTVEFSKNGKVQLLERAGIEKVYREQGLSAANRDPLKLGQLLGADGLLLLQTGSNFTNEFASVELVAVKPGVLLSSERFGWPLKRPAEWAAQVEKRLEPLLPKLGVLAKDATPISVVNLRSAIESAESRDAERQLTLLAIERLSREKQLFVLERRRMQALSAEKELPGVDDSAFWNGSYLLDGTVDNGGYSARTITISARLVPPTGGASMAIEVSGSRTNLAEVVNRLADQILEKLRLGPSSAPWNASAEASQFYAEAQWAMHWQLYPQAQAASESAWALGKHDVETAELRIRAYSENVPLGNGRYFGPTTSANECLRVDAMPDAEKLNSLSRALEIFHQNAKLLLEGTNAEAGVDLAIFQLLRAAGLLESYYYAAEARTDHQESLHNLREGVRMLTGDLEERPFPPVARNRTWTTPKSAFDWFKWEEGGLSFEQPEAALPMLHNMLESGFHPGHLPRLVGWSWEDRKRVPKLLRQFVADAGASTNRAVRVEALFLGVVLAPDDEQNSRQNAEQALTAAMWENRDLLFTNADFASLIWRTHDALRAVYDSGDANEFFEHEPFASCKHRLEMDFLARATTNNLSVLWQWIPFTTERLESPEQARELLPQLLGLEQKCVLPPRLRSLLHEVQVVAGATPTQAAPVVPAQPPAEVLEAKFIPWDLRRFGVSPERKARFAGMILRNGQLWLHVRYYEPNADEVFGAADTVSTYIAVDAQSGLKTEIPFPAKLGVPDDLFEVSSNQLFVSAEGHLYAYKFAHPAWEEIQVPMDGVTQLVWLKDRLLLGRNDGLMEVEINSRQVRLLVSARRQPAANEGDPLWTPMTKIFPWSDGTLGALSGGQCLTWNATDGRWSIRGVSELTGTNTNLFRSAGRWFVSGDGAVQCFGYIPRRYWVGFWNDGKPGEPLLMDAMHFTANQAHPEPKNLPSVRWDWPASYPLESANLIAVGRKLWVLAPRLVYGRYSPIPEEPLKFSDARQATLFCFKLDSRQPLTLALRFAEYPGAEKASVNGRNFTLSNPLARGRYDMVLHSAPTDGNAGLFWLETKDGLIFGGPRYSGHWLIPEATLAEKFKSQPEALSQPASQPKAPAGAPPKL